MSSLPYSDVFVFYQFFKKKKCVSYKAFQRSTHRYRYGHGAGLKVKSMQRSGTEAIRTQIQSSKPKREITKITNSQNTKRRYGQPSEQLFPKRWPLSNPNRTKNQRTNGPVNAHLISGPTISTKTSFAKFDIVVK